LDELAVIGKNRVEVGIIAPVLGVVLAAIVVLVLWRVMRMRGSRSDARTRAPALSESEAEFLDSSHIISGPLSGGAADPRRNPADPSAPPRNRVP
jgi:hypothetical protein